MNIALVAIAKNEDDYIEEWIRYNLKLGFTKIFIYQNDWRIKESQYIESIKDKLVLIPFDGEPTKYYNKQLEAYNFFIDEHYIEYDWAAFFDVDEFLYVRNMKLEDFLNKYNSCKSI